MIDRFGSSTGSNPLKFLCLIPTALSTNPLLFFLLCPTDTRNRATFFLQTLRSSMPFILNLESRTCLQLAPYGSATTTGPGAPFGEDRYPVTVFLALTVLTTISYNMGVLPLKNCNGSFRLLSFFSYCLSSENTANVNLLRFESALFKVRLTVPTCCFCPFTSVNA